MVPGRTNRLYNTYTVVTMDLSCKTTPLPWAVLSGLGWLSIIIPGDHGKPLQTPTRRYVHLLWSNLIGQNVTTMD